MATVFSIYEVHRIAGTPPAHVAKMDLYRGIDPAQLAGRPDLQRDCIFWQQQELNVEQSPLIQQSITARAPGLNIPSPQGMSIAQAARRGLYGQQPAQVQQAQVHKGAVAYVQQAPDPELQKAARDLQRSINELPARLAAAVQRSQATAQRRPDQVQRSRVLSQSKPVLRSLEGGQAAPAQGLPVSPITGQPSSITGLVRRSVGLDGGPTPPQNLPNQKAVEYYQQQQVANQVAVQKAQYEQSLPISPHTGQPSSLTQMVRASVGLK